MYVDLSRVRGWNIIKVDSPTLGVPCLGFNRGGYSAGVQGSQGGRGGRGGRGSRGA